nr:collagen alpha-1(I) chain-like [Chlorocebus sabaeus]
MPAHTCLQPPGRARTCMRGTHGHKHANARSRQRTARGDPAGPERGALAQTRGASRDPAAGADGARAGGRAGAAGAAQDGARAAGRARRRRKGGQGRAGAVRAPSPGSQRQRAGPPPSATAAPRRPPGPGGPRRPRRTGSAPHDPLPEAGSGWSGAEGAAGGCPDPGRLLGPARGPSCSAPRLCPQAQMVSGPGPPGRRRPSTLRTWHVGSRDERGGSGAGSPGSGGVLPEAEATDRPLSAPARDPGRNKRPSLGSEAANSWLEPLAQRPPAEPRASLSHPWTSRLGPQPPGLPGQPSAPQIEAQQV